MSSCSAADLNSFYISLDERKDIVKSAIDALLTSIEDHDRAELSCGDDISNEDVWYGKQMENLEVLRKELQTLRELGGRFFSTPPNTVTVTAYGHIIVFPGSFNNKDKSSVKSKPLSGINGSDVYPIDRLLRIRDMSSSISTNDNIVKKPLLHPFRLEWKEGHGKSLTVSVSEPSEFMEVVGCHLKRYNTRKVRQIRRLQELYGQLVCPFDASCPHHERLLKRMWIVISPETAHQKVIGPSQWKLALGFDPVTDFRAVGVLACQNLVYFAEHYRREFLDILRSSVSYPVAQVGVCITRIIAQELHLTEDLVSEPVTSTAWDSSTLSFLCHLDHDDGYSELYYLLFSLFHTEMLRVSSEQTGHMASVDISVILDRTRQRLHSILKFHPESVFDFLALMHTKNI